MSNSSVVTFSAFISKLMLLLLLLLIMMVGVILIVMVVTLVVVMMIINLDDNRIASSHQVPNISINAWSLHQRYTSCTYSRESPFRKWSSYTRCKVKRFLKSPGIHCRIKAFWRLAIELYITRLNYINIFHHTVHI